MSLKHPTSHHLQKALRQPLDTTRAQPSANNPSVGLFTRPFPERNNKPSGCELAERADSDDPPTPFPPRRQRDGAPRPPDCPSRDAHHQVRDVSPASPLCCAQRGGQGIIAHTRKPKGPYSGKDRRTWEKLTSAANSSSDSSPPSRASAPLSSPTRRQFLAPSPLHRSKQPPMRRAPSISSRRHPFRATRPSWRRRSAAARETR